MGRYDLILQRLAQWADSCEKLYAAVVIGSQAREDRPADEYSDLDIILTVDEPEDFLGSDAWLKELGEPRVSFVEDSLGGSKERRVLFEGALDVDFVIFTREGLQMAAKELGDGILKRGYRVLVDKIGLEALLPKAGAPGTGGRLLTEAEFCNLVQDFWYHGVWTAKKLLRGELWTAKDCVDNYMKWKLLALAECYAHAFHGPSYDTWHSGRFLEEWAEEWFVRYLSNIYAHYDRREIEHALLATMDLFRRMAKDVGGRLGYAYPAQADAYSTAWVKQALRTVGKTES